MLTKIGVMVADGDGIGAKRYLEDEFAIKGDVGEDEFRAADELLKAIAKES